MLASRGGSRDGIVGSTKWPIRATASARANGPHHHYDARLYDGAHHDACPFDAPRYDKDADSVSDLLSISGAYGVPCGFTVSFTLTGSIEGDGGCCSIRRTRAGPLSASAGRVGVGYRTGASLASPLYSPEYVEGISVLKISLGGRFRPRSGTKTPVLARFEPDFWSLSAQSPHFQHAGVFSKVGIAPVQQPFAYLAEIGWCKELS